MSVEELRTRAETGSVVAQTVLGISYLHGHEVARDPGEAFRWLTLAAEAGAARAEAWLGAMYEEGIYVEVNLARARELYARSSERGEFLGCIFLARALATGKGGSVDEAAAAYWYGQALKMSVEECPEVEEARRYLG